MGVGIDEAGKDEAAIEAMHIFTGRRCNIFIALNDATSIYTQLHIFNRGRKKLRDNYVFQKK
jgi:hypothetical protein